MMQTCAEMTFNYVLWLMVVVGLGVAFWTARHRIVALERRLEDLKRIEELRGLEQQFYLKRIYELENAAGEKTPWVQKTSPDDDSAAAIPN